MPNPMKIDGAWTEGYVLDYHIIKSIRLPNNELGHQQFDTTRTELGELIYRMKYNGHHDTSAEIIDLCSDFLDIWLANKNIDVIIPVPPSVHRSFQPVFQLVKAISKHYKIPYIFDVLEKSTETISKDMERSHKTITVSANKSAKRKCNILMVDDLFDTGATANACVQILRNDKNVNDIYFMAFTRRKP